MESGIRTPVGTADRPRAGLGSACEPIIIDHYYLWAVVYAEEKQITPPMLCRVPIHVHWSQTLRLMRSNLGDIIKATTISAPLLNPIPRRSPGPRDNSFSHPSHQPANPVHKTPRNSKSAQESHRQPPRKQASQARKTILRPAPSHLPRSQPPIHLLVPPQPRDKASKAHHTWPGSSG